MLTAELEIYLSPADGGYAVAMRFRHAEGDVDQVLPPGRTSLDPTGLRTLGENCGPGLTRQLFSDPAVLRDFIGACTASESAGMALRVRLFVDARAPELHGVPWELLGDPRRLPAWDPLALDQNVTFSRYLAGDDWRPVQTRIAGELNALIAVADPADLGSYQLSPVDADGEIGRAKQALGRDVRATAVCGPRTLDRIRAELRDAPEILYLACHGSHQEGETWLWLEGEPVEDGAQGQVDRLGGEAFLAELVALPPARRPLLVVLASCQSSGAGDQAMLGDGGVLAALGPRLAAAGIPAVIAMQGNVSMRTVERLMPTFFAELCIDGQVDRAMAAARVAVRGRADFWVPVLFLRLRGGVLWIDRYRDDIESLKSYSNRGLEIQASLSAIRLHDQDIRIERPIVATLDEAVEGSSVLVVGEPGAGKSAAMIELARGRRDAGWDVIYLDVSRVEAGSLAGLRTEIGLGCDVAEVLAGWRGGRPGLLIVDAVDAARSPGVAQAMRDLIAAVMESDGRWRVAASVREYDLLRHGGELRAMFPGEPIPGLAHPDFPDTLHVRVPIFGDEELAQVCAQSAELAALLAEATVPLHDLLRNPFNLRLAAEILDSGAGAGDLTPIRSQVELLDRYWESRVIYDDQADAREAVLRRAAAAMVERRRLRASRAEIASDPAASAPLARVLSARVLLEWRPRPDLPPDRHTLSFAHDILFDYAVATLLLRGHPETVPTRLATEPDLALAIRPSLVLFFQSAWVRDPTRNDFWSMAFQILRPGDVPEIGMLVAPGVAAEMLAEAWDCDPLFAVLDGDDPTIRELGERTLRHLVGWFLAAPDLVRRQPLAWCEIAERVSRSLRTATAPSAANLVRRLCKEAEQLTPDKQDLIGQASRRLLEYAWGQESPRRDLTQIALETVCSTFCCNPAESGASLRRALEPQHLAEHGHEELLHIARRVDQLAADDPQGLRIRLG